MDTGDGVVGHGVVPVHCLEALHAEKEQVVGIGVLGQLTKLETGRSGASGVALARGFVVVGAAYSDNSNDASGRLALDVVLEVWELLAELFGECAGMVAMLEG